VCGLYFAGHVLGELFSPEDEGIMFLGNVGELYTTARRYVPEDSTLKIYKIIHSHPLFQR
jgi:hypothetical protein